MRIRLVRVELVHADIRQHTNARGRTDGPRDEANSRFSQCCEHNAHAPCFIVTCGLSGTILFSQCLINDTIFERKKVIEHKMCVLIFSTTFV
jgi:hypothetical protein